MVHEDECQHGFGNRCRTDADARIMAAIGFDRDRIALLVDRLARNADARRGLNADGHDDILPGGNTAENAASMVGEKSFGRQFITMF